MPVEGKVGTVGRKLDEYGEVRGLVVAAFKEVNEGLNELVTIALHRKWDYRKSESMRRLRWRFRWRGSGRSSV